jgi:hypothetical protein
LGAHDKDKDNDNDMTMTMTATAATELFWSFDFLCQQTKMEQCRQFFGPLWVGGTTPKDKHRTEAWEWRLVVCCRGRVSLGAPPVLVCFWPFSTKPPLSKNPSQLSYNASVNVNVKVNVNVNGNTNANISSTTTSSEAA